MMDQSAPYATEPIGSSEPLDRAQTFDRLRELEAWGVDLSLIQANLRCTDEQRIARNESLAHMLHEMQTALHKGQVLPLTSGRGIHHADVVR